MSFALVASSSASSALLHHSVYWFAATLCMLLEIYVFDGFFFGWLPIKFSSSFICAIEVTILCITSANALYCFISYLSCWYSNIKTDLFSGSVHSFDPNKTEARSVDSNRADCIRSLYAFMGNYFKQPISASKQSTTSFSSSFSDLDARSSSLSSLIGYHDSPLNKTVTSIHSRSQLNDILENETCDSVIDSIDCAPFFNYDVSAGNWYQMGTSQQPLTAEESDALNAIKAFNSEYSSTKYQRRPEKRIFHRKRSDSSSKTYTETDINEILKIYQLNKSDFEIYEIKLRIWICNTIIRPLIEKIEETNRLLGEKHSSLHLKIGTSHLDTLQSALMHKQDLCKTLIPFILPYLRIHNNQQYIVERIQILGRNIALEEFKWNGGGDQTMRNENNSFDCVIRWTEQMPTDSELIWHLFCTYMDFHLSPSSEAVSAATEFNKPFTNVFFIKTADGKLPLALGTDSLFSQQQNEASDKIFVRMKSHRPPIFELVVDKGETILLPNKEGPQNFWIVFVLFLAHVKKVTRSRIGHLHLSSLSLDIFDL